MAVASCTAATAYGYCHKHDLPLPTGMTVHVDEVEASGGRVRPDKITFEIQLPGDFPQSRLEAVQKAADTCWVKQKWLNPPDFETVVVQK